MIEIVALGLLGQTVRYIAMIPPPWQALLYSTCDKAFLGFILHTHDHLSDLVYKIHCMKLFLKEEEIFPWQVSQDDGTAQRILVQREGEG